MNRPKRTLQIEPILVMILLICFCAAAAVLIGSGQQSFRRILDNRDRTGNLRIAFAYINMRIRQHDAAGRIVFMEDRVEGQDALVIYHSGPEEGLVTYIFHLDGVLWESYDFIDREPTREYSFKIIDLEHFTMEYHPEHHYLLISSVNQRGVPVSQVIALRTREESP